MSSLYDLPEDILREIFSLCSEHRALTETCHYFSTTIYSLAQFCDIHIGPRQLDLDPDFLRARLERLSSSLRLVSIGPIAADTIERPLVETICATLVEFNTKITELEISAESGLDAGSLLSRIFGPGFVVKPVMIFPNLKRLSVHAVTQECSGYYAPVWPQLDIVLEHAAEKFPNLQILSLPNLIDYVPNLCRVKPPLSNLRALILDGSHAERSIRTSLIVELLRKAPLLETLWIKHPAETNTKGPENPMGSRFQVPPRLVLSCLTSLAITTSVIGTNLLNHIEAPSLRDLHLDGSWDSRDSSEDSDDPYLSPVEDHAMADVLSVFAQRSTRWHLRRLALTAPNLTEEDWKWLLFAGSPFPRLESLAVHLLQHPTSGFGDDLFLPCLENQGPMVSLHRLAIRNCKIPLTGSVLVRVLGTSGLNGLPKEGFELELDDLGPQFSEEEVGVLAQVGVKLIRRGEGETNEDDWWELGHGINSLDSHIY